MVDDDELVRELLVGVLTGVGYTVAASTAGRQALEHLATPSAPPDLVICDVNMPGMDGFELLAQLRADPATSWVPFIFLTSRGSTSDVVEGLGLGADDYLVKPFAVPELLARVKTKMERPPTPSELLSVDSRTGLVGARRLADELAREMARSAKSGAAGTLAPMWPPAGPSSGTGAAAGAGRWSACGSRSRWR